MFYLRENEEPESVVGRVSATDRDAGRNADLSYKFASSHNHYFSIDQKTGLISSAVTVDRSGH